MNEETPNIPAQFAPPETHRCQCIPEVTVDFVEECSVRVMRSHDYCHFEVVLGYVHEPGQRILLSAVDDLRKVAARLVDKAVEQYKVKKIDLYRQENNAQYRDSARPEAQRIEAKPETDRTPEEQALLKRYRDAVFEASRGYDYRDDWEEQP